MANAPLKIPIPVIVEGKYDKIKLSSVIDAHILPTGGFSLFRQKEKTALLRRICAEKGVIVLTDSDGGGRQIRSFLSGILPKEKVYHLYIPQVKGKEKRKEKTGKAGLLGVEGMDTELLYTLFLPFAGEAPEPKGGMSKADFYLYGLSGTDKASENRRALCAALGFPDDMTANALLEAVNLLYTKEEFEELLQTQK